MNKKLSHDLERHMSILSAPNYNLNLILREGLTGFTVDSSHKLNINNRCHEVSEFSVETNHHEDRKKSLHNRSMSSSSNTNNTHHNLPSKPDYKKLVLEGPKSFKDFSCYGKHHNIKDLNRGRALDKIKKVLQKEKTSLKCNTRKIDEELVEYNKKCTIAAAEKIELIEECDQVEISIGEYLKTKNEINSRTLYSQRMDTSPNETMETTNEATITAPNLQGKYKKITELKKTLSSLQKIFDDAKGKIKDKEIAAKQIRKENAEIKAKIEERNNLISIYKNEINYLNKHIQDKKEMRPSTSTKIISGIRSIFSSGKKKG